MDSRFRIAKNTVVLILLRVATPLLSLALVVAVSRFLGVEGLGRYSLAFTFLLFFNTVAPLGLHALITREGARDGLGLDILLANAIVLGTVGSIASMLLMITIGPALGYDAATCSALTLLSLALLPSALAAYFDAAFVALERMEYMAVATLADNALKIALGLTVLLLGYGIEAVILAAVAARVLACGVSGALLRRLGVGLRLRLDRGTLRYLAREAPTFVMISIFATIYWNIDMVMLSTMRTVEDVGQYAAAWRLLTLAIVVPQSFCHALYPQIARAIHSAPETLAWLGRTASRYLLAVTLPAAVCATLLAGPILAFLYGEPFRPTAATLSVLVWTVVPYGWVRYHAYVLVAADRQRVDLSLNVAMSVLNILLNLALIPAYGHLGAAVATLISVCVYAASQYAYLYVTLPTGVTPFRLEPAAIVGVVLAAAVAGALRDGPVLLALGGATMVYLGVLLGMGFVRPTTVRSLGLRHALGIIRPSTR
jgi:O-antigen/teichoic acid export membrane protein